VFIAEVFIGSSSHSLNMVTYCKVGVFNNQQLTRQSNGHVQLARFRFASHFSQQYLAAYCGVEAVEFIKSRNSPHSFLLGERLNVII
jgi:hypothetical protein